MMSYELELVSLAVAGDCKSQYELAKMYLEGKTVQVDKKKAARWFKNAADNGHVRSKYELACLYNSIGSDEEKALIIPLMESASNSGDSDASMYLLKSYRSGEYADYTKVVSCLRKCADGGSNRCKMNLAELLYKSDSREDRLESIKLCYELAMDGEKDAMFRLYLQYRYAVGTKSDMRVARMWLEKAAENGHNGAKKELESFPK